MSCLLSHWQLCFHQTPNTRRHLCGPLGFSGATWWNGSKVNTNTHSSSALERERERALWLYVDLKKQHQDEYWYNGIWASLFMTCNVWGLHYRDIGLRKPHKWNVKHSMMWSRVRLHGLELGRQAVDAALLRKAADTTQVVVSAAHAVGRVLRM